MQYSHVFVIFSILLIYFNSICKGDECSYPPKFLAVSKSGHGKLRTIKSAIDYVPYNNTQWYHIKISPGHYAEKLYIPQPCVFLEGEGSKSTVIKWGDHIREGNSTTFETAGPNFVAKGITFVNTYNRPPRDRQRLPAVAVKVKGDQAAFFDCSFKGVQDTLSDANGRHYFHNCYIQGATDFIFGNGQSIYEKCMINYKPGPDGPLNGVITAQGRNSMDDTSGFVFKYCTINGDGMTRLGRPYRSFARVIITNSYLSEKVDPEGWSSSSFPEANLTFVEEGCFGPGANNPKRVPWMKHMNKKELNKFASLSYIDNNGWLSKLPPHMGFGSK